MPHVAQPLASSDHHPIYSIWTPTPCQNVKNAFGIRWIKIQRIIEPCLVYYIKVIMAVVVVVSGDDAYKTSTDNDQTQSTKNNMNRNIKYNQGRILY